MQTDTENKIQNAYDYLKNHQDLKEFDFKIDKSNIEITDENIKALFDGVELTLKELLSTVSRFGVEPVGAVGDTFNPDLHQAISMQPAEGFTTNQITTVLQKGYTLNGRVIRPAMVMVAA